MDREKAMELVQEHVQNANLFKHCLATEAIMRKLAIRLGEESAEQDWALAGLLHDLDFDQTKNDPSQHGLRTAEILEQQGVAPHIIEAVKRHNAEALGLQRESKLHHALAAAETITGLIVATALVYPDKKLASVKPSSIRKRMKKKDFARNVNREIIMECEKIGLTLADFIELCLSAMQEIAPDLGL